VLFEDADDLLLGKAAASHVRLLSKNGLYPKLRAPPGATSLSMPIINA